MQKVINVLALASFTVSGLVVAGGVYVYQNKDIIANDIKRNLIKGVTEAVQDQLPGMLDNAVEVPSATSELPVTMPAPETRPAF
jgi:hypothetical protein